MFGAPWLKTAQWGSWLSVWHMSRSLRKTLTRPGCCWLLVWLRSILFLFHLLRRSIWLAGLQPAIVFICRLSSQLSVKKVGWLFILFHRNTSRLLVLSNQQSETQRFFIYYREWKINGSKSLHLRWITQIFDIFAKKWLKYFLLMD